MRQTTLTQGGLALSVTLASLVLSSCGVERSGEHAPDVNAENRPAGSDVVLVMDSSDESFPIPTAQDWVSYADAVAVGTVVEEQLASVGLDFPIVPRTVTVELKSPIWTSEQGGRQSFPREVNFYVAGWSGVNGAESTTIDELPRLAFRNSPRLDVGHSYLIALYFEESPCPAEQEGAPGGAWRILAPDTGIIPYDEGIAGVGEFEGKERTRSQAAASVVTAGNPRYGFDDIVFGLSADGVGQILKKTPAVTGKRRIAPPDPESCAELAQAPRTPLG